jgi:hypothetical protein
MPAATFSLREFDIAWSSLHVGTPPFPLTVPSHGRTARDRDDIRSAVFARLCDRGIAVGTRLRAEWADLLGVLARPERSVDAVGGIGRPLAAIAAAAPGVAALAVLSRDSVVLGQIPAGSLVASVVALLPAAPAGPGHPVVVPVDAVHRFLADTGPLDPDDLAWLDDDPLAAAGLPVADAGLLVRLAEGRRHGGLFGVNVRDLATGRLRRGIPVVSWFDTAEGRYLMTNDGTTLVIAPADSARIAVRLHEVLDGHR